MQKDISSTPSVSDELLPTAEATEALKLSAHWLHRARSHGKGPRFVRLGRKVYYRRSDIDAYLASCIVETADTRADG